MVDKSKAECRERKSEATKACASEELWQPGVVSYEEICWLKKYVIKYWFINVWQMIENYFFRLLTPPPLHRSSLLPFPFEAEGFRYALHARWINEKALWILWGMVVRLRHTRENWLGWGTNGRVHCHCFNVRISFRNVRIFLPLALLD